MLKTKRLYLRPMLEEDAQFIVEMRNNSKILNSLFSYKMITVQEHLKWYKNNLNNDNRIDLMIGEKDDNKLIGTVNLVDIDYKNQKAEFGIIIAESFWNKGYAYESSQRFIDHSFNHFNLNKIYLEVLKENNAAINLYEKLGFKKEGILKEDIFKNGKFKDVLIMSLFRDDLK
jgi:UDP-4-amino-4,6-dideoxy-N-acetyl-beta-L-altrosamine N-acetyltransferase